MQTVLPHKIRKAREAAHLNQGAFARAVGLSSEYISLLEAGKRTPSMATLEKRGKIPGRTTSKWPLLPPSGGRYG